MRQRKKPCRGVAPPLAMALCRGYANGQDRLDARWSNSCDIKILAILC